MLEIADSVGDRGNCLNIVDQGTTLQVVALVRTGGGIQYMSLELLEIFGIAGRLSL